MKAQDASSLASLLDQGLVWSPEQNSARTFHKASYSKSANSTEAVSFNIPEIDSELPGGGLALRSLHEMVTARSSVVLPALLARQRIRQFFLSREELWKDRRPEFPYLLIWIGRNCWPSPIFLNEALSFKFPCNRYSFLNRCIFIDPSDEALALWTLDLALRSRAVGFVTSVSPHISLSISRRLSLAAKSGNALCLLLRNYRNRAGPSTATTRWELTPQRTKDPSPLWDLTLQKIKGASPSIRSWQVCLGNSGSLQTSTKEGSISDLEGTSDFDIFSCEGSPELRLFRQVLSSTADGNDTSILTPPPETLPLRVLSDVVDRSCETFSFEEQKHRAVR